MCATSLFLNPPSTFKSARASFAVVAAAAALFAMQQAGHAVQIQDLTTNTTLFYDNFSNQAAVSSAVAPDTAAVTSYQPNSALIGTWASYAGDAPTNFVSTQVTNSTASPDPAPYSPSGSSNYLRLYRDATTTPAPYNGGNAAALASSPDTTFGDVVEFRTMVYLPSGTETNARAQIYMMGPYSDISSAYATSTAWARPDGAGNVDAVVGDGLGDGNVSVLPTGLHYATNTWQEWDLTYTIGSSKFSVTVNGVTASGFSSPFISDSVVGTFLANGNGVPAGSVYFAAVSAPVPEPSSAVLLVLGGVGLVLWRRLKK